MKKILVPVDFSKHSENALKVAAKIAKQHDLEILVVHMMGLSDAVITKEDDSMEGMFFLQLTQKRFEEFLDKDYLKAITIHQTVKNYKVFSEIDAVAIAHDADLIIMGSHGSSGISEVFVGSNTEKVVRTASVPVLVIKDDQDFEVSKAVLASDYKLESLTVFKTMTSLFNILGIEVKLLYVNVPDQSYKSTNEIDQRIANFIIHLKGDYKLLPEDVTVYSDYSIERGIFNYAKKIKADIIGIPTHGRKGLAHFFSGSISEDVVNHSKLPVLTVKM